MCLPGSDCQTADRCLIVADGFTSGKTCFRRTWDWMIGSVRLSSAGIFSPRSEIIQNKEPNLMRHFLAILSALALFQTSASLGATFTWDGHSGSDNVFSTGGNWIGNVAPTSSGTTDLVFTTSGSNRIISFQSNPSFILHSLTISSANTNWRQIFGGTLDFRNNGSSDPTITQNAAISGTISNPLTLTNNLTVGVTSSGPLTIEGAVSGAGTFTKTGTGTLTLTGSSNYTGDTAVSAGTVAINGNGAIVSGSNSSLLVNSGGHLTISGSGNISVGTAYVGNGNSGTGDLVQSGGNLTSNSFLYLGFLPGANGTYALGGGSVSSKQTLVSDDANTSSFTQTGGLHTTGTLTLGSFSASANGTYVLTGGTLAAGFVSRDKGTGVFDFNGGTLKPTVSSTTFLQNLTTANVQAGGAKVDTNGFNVTIAQPLLHDAALGATADGGLTKSGSGTLTLTMSSSYTGNTNVTFGSLVVTGSGAFGSVTGDVLAGGSLGSPASLVMSGNSIVTGRIGEMGFGTNRPANFTQNGGTANFGSNFFVGYDAGSDSTYTLNQGSLTTFDTIVSTDNNISSFIQTGGRHTTGGLVLGTFSTSPNGTYVLTGGTLAAGSVTRNQGTGVFNFNGGALQPTASTTVFFQGLTAANVQAGGAMIDTNGFNVTIAQPLLHDAALGATADGGLIKSGSGTLTLTGSSNYTGGTLVSSGTLAVPSGNVGVSGTGNFIVETSSGAAATVLLSGSGRIAGYQLLVGDSGPGNFIQSGGSVTTSGDANNGLYLGYNAGGFGTYTLSGGGSLSVRAVLVGASGVGNYIQNGGTVGSGQIFLGVLAGGQGTYALNSGTLTTASIIGFSGTSTFKFNGGTLQASANDGLFGTLFFDQLTTANVQLGGAKIDTNGFNITIAQPLLHDPALSGTADGGLTKSGSGTLTLTGSSSYAGQTTVTSGTLSITGSGSVGGLTSPFIVDGSAGANATTLLSGIGRILAKFVTIGSSGTGSFVQSGGTLMTGTGSTADHVSLGASNGGSGFYTLSGGGSITTYSLEVGNSGSGSFTQGGGTILAVGDTLISGGSNTSSFTQTGGLHTTGELDLGEFSSSANGTYLLTGGTLATTSVLRVSGIGIFNFNGGTLQPTVSGTSFIQNLTAANVQAGGAKIDTNGFNVTIPQALLHDAALGSTADGGLIKSGTGTLTLIGPNTYTGPVTINAGVLSVPSATSLGAGKLITVNPGSQLIVTASASLSGTLVNNGIQTGGPLTFSSGGVVSGTGSFGALAIKNAGRISPGNSPGSMTVSSLELGAGGSYKFELNSTAPALGIGSDFISVSGALSISALSGTGNQFTIAVVSLDGSNNPGLLSGFNASQPSSFTLAFSNGGISGFAANKFAVDTSGFQNNLNGGSFSVAQSANSLLLNFTPVPEPSAGALALLAGVGLMLSRQCRRRRLHR
jgi:autotransporter-associated beta strand protein